MSSEVTKDYLPTCNDTCLDAFYEARDKIDRLTGGSTTYKAEGCFITDGEDVCEPVMVVETAHQCFTRDQGREFIKILVDYGEKANQEYIALAQGKFNILKTEEVAKELKKRAEKGFKLRMF